LRLADVHPERNGGYDGSNGLILKEKTAPGLGLRTLTSQGAGATVSPFRTLVFMKICPICKADYERGEIFCPVDGARLSSPSEMVGVPLSSGQDPLIGTTLAERYKILRPIGEGGMGIVYEAMHVVIEKKVALKVLRDDFSKRTEVVERFRQEAKSASRIGHEHIVDISDFGETPGGQSYFVMEHLEGEDLANVLAREGTLSPQRAVHIAAQCARALGAAHAKGIVHRDMKPENIFLVTRENQEDFVKIVDFGIAKMSDIEMEGAPGRKLTKTGMIFGTPEYMSPEQAAGKPLDHRVDVYSMGVIVYECVTGRVPFVGDTFMGILTQHMFEEVPLLSVVNPNVHCGAELETVILRALAKDPDERFRSMDEFGRALAGAMDLSGAHVFSETTAPGYGEPVRPRAFAAKTIPAVMVDSSEFPVSRPRSRLGFAIGAAAAVALLGAGVTAYVTLAPSTTAVANGPDVRMNAANGPRDTLGAGSESSQGGGAGEAAQVPPRAPDAGGGALAMADVVSVRVDTEPSGARITVDGRGQVCDASPCTFETTAGQSIRVRARRGRHVAVRDLEPTEATTLEMTLAAQVRPEQGSSQMGGNSPHMGGTSAGELKVPDIFRRP